MKTVYQIPGTNIQFEADPDLLTITITQGEVASKAAFLELVKSHYLLTLINQFLLKDSGCVDPNAYDICQAIKLGDAERAYSIASDWYHEFDRYRILVCLK